MDTYKDNMSLILDKFTSTVYKAGYKQGERDALIAIAKWYKDECTESNLCIQSLMEWDDDGCCLDCIECVKNHCNQHEVNE